jgi:hypothetical protein
MKLKMLLAVGLTVSLYATDVMAQVPLTWLGTWKLNVEKSHYQPGPPPKSQIDRREAVEGALKYMSDRVYSDGKTGRHEYTVKFDGKDYPYVGSPNSDTISMTKVNDNAVEWVLKKGGAAWMSGRTVFEGKVCTMTWAVTNAKGEKIESIAVFEKQ